MKAIIICDGDIPGKPMIVDELSSTDLVIAADGGAYHAQRLHLNPDVIIGDLDSYTVTGDESATVIHDPDQENNDLEKALAYAKNNSVNNVVVFGTTGKRLDHTLKNLSVLLQFDPLFDSIVFKDGYSVMKIIHSPFRASFELGTSLSLFPLSGTIEGITTRGLKYPLQNELLKNGMRDGTSNETVEKTVEIEFKKGDLLLLINH
jgi:thiamine pyrophosphokinase